MHYFEEGNVQLNTSTSGNLNIAENEREGSKLASTIAEDIRKVEKQYLISLEVF